VLKYVLSIFSNLQINGTVFSSSVRKNLTLICRFMQDLVLEEAHPLAVKLSFAISVGLLPVTLSLKTVSCGIRNSGLPEEEAGDLESSSKNPNQIPTELSVTNFTFGDSFFCRVLVF